jgi:hypothetical protein
VLGYTLLYYLINRETHNGETSIVEGYSLTTAPLFHALNAGVTKLLNTSFQVFTRLRPGLVPR